jgi:hypothetical protein
MFSLNWYLARLPLAANRPTHATPVPKTMCRLQFRRSGYEALRTQGLLKLYSPKPAPIKNMGAGAIPRMGIRGSPADRTDRTDPSDQREPCLPIT